MHTIKKVISVRGIVTICVFLCLVTPVASAQKAFRGVKVCVDFNKSALVLRKRCKEPRFKEVTPGDLSSALSLQLVRKEVDVNLSSANDITGNSVACPEGMIVTGGGAGVINSTRLRVRRSIPSSDLSGWSASVEAVSNNATGELSIYAICTVAELIEDSDS